MLSLIAYLGPEPPVGKWPFIGIAIVVAFALYESYMMDRSINKSNDLIQKLEQKRREREQELREKNKSLTAWQEFTKSKD